jgi:SAM-dependent methyltransferase
LTDHTDAPGVPDSRLSRRLYRLYAAWPWLNPRVGFLLKTPRDGRWLDVGGGNGYVFRELHALREDLDALACDVQDFSACYAGLKNVAFAQVAGLRWPVEDASVDVLTSLHVVEHLTREERKAFYAEVARVLKPGGRFYIETPSPRSLWLPPVKSAHGPTNFWQEPTHVEVVGREELYEGFRGSGFKDVRVRLFRNRFFVLAAPFLLPIAFFPPGNLAYHYTMPNLVGWSNAATGTRA